MNKETLRMQMLAGVITEGQYKEKLEENAASNLELKSLAKQLYLGFKKLGAAPKLLTTKMEIGKKGSWEDGVNITIFSGEDTISVNINSKGIGVPKAEGIKNNIEKSFPKAIFTPVNGGKDWEGNPIISFNITPGKDMSESLNESMIGGIVGIGAINQIPPRAKTDYEDAFEHFLGQKYKLQEAEPGNLMLSNAAKKIYQYITSNGFKVHMVIGDKKIGDRNSSQFFIQATLNTSTGDNELNIQGNQVQPDVVEKLSKDIMSNFPWLKLKNSGQGSFTLSVDKKANVTESLAEGDVMVDSMALASYIDELVSLADDMEYAPYMVEELQDLKAGLPGGEMSVENALNIIKQTIDITGDEIGEVEALGQAIDYDDAIIAKAREIAGLDEGKEVEEPYNY